MPQTAILFASAHVPASGTSMMAACAKAKKQSLV